MKPDSTEDDWKKFFMVSKCLWYSPIRAGKKKRGANLLEFQRRIQLWNENKILELWNEFKEFALNHESAHVKGKLNKINNNNCKVDEKSNLSNDDKYKIRRSQFYIRYGDVSGATNIMLSNGLCSNSPQIRQQLIEKHPSEPEYQPQYSNSLTSQISAQIEDVRKSISKIKRTKAPGPDGWRPVFWKPILRYCFDERILKKLTILINKIFCGAFNKVLGSNFSTSRGIPLAKDSSKLNVRPIAIGLSFRRLCTSIVNRKINQKLTQTMCSMNFGNSKNGIPIFVHFLRNLIDFKNLKNEKNFSVLEFDISNAFNDIKRSYMREVCETYFPSILRYFDLTYAKHSSLIFPNNFILSSQRGFQQGDGLSVMFSLCLYHLFHKEKMYKEMYFLKFFHDDGRCVVPIDKIQSTLEFVLSKLKEVGLTLNLSKTKIYVAAEKLNEVEYLKNILKIQIHSGFNFEMLGSYIGCEKETKIWLKKKLDEYDKFLKLLNKFDYKQSKWRVLSYFTGYSKFQNVIRTIPAKFLQDFILEIDKKVIDIVCTIIESPLDPNQLIQVSLPLSFGGLGVLCLKTYSLAIKSALWSQIGENLFSLLVTEGKFFDRQTFNVVNSEYYNFKEKFITSTECKIPDEVPDSSWLIQKHLVQRIAEKQWNKIYTKEIPKYHQARLLACRAKASSGWVFSSAAPFTRLTNNQFRIISSFWLGVPLINKHTKCKKCDMIVDKYGAHTITCNRGMSLSKRHNYIRNFLYRKCLDAGYVTYLEKKHIDTSSGKKPADIWVQHLINNKPTAIDVSITSPTQVTIVKDNNKSIFKAAKIVEKQKKSKYSDTIEKGEVEFIPFVVEAFGGISSEAMKFLKRLSSDLRDRTRQAQSVIISNLMKCITVRVWKANVEAFNLRTFSVLPVKKQALLLFLFFLFTYLNIYFFKARKIR